MENNGYSLTDIASVLGGVGGGNCNILWIIIIFVFLSMFNGGWGNRGDYGQYATAASQQEILFGQQFQNLDNKMDRLGNGIADATFALNSAIKDGNAAVSSAVVTEGRALQSQLADHNCMVQRNTDALRYDISQMFASYGAATSAQIQSVKDMICTNEMKAMEQKIATLEMQNAMSNVVRYPNAWTYNAGTSPFCNCGNGCCN